MKVLMINSNRYKAPAPIIPFGLCCVAAAVENAGHQVKVLDLCFSKNCSRDINNSVIQFQPDIIGINIRNIDTAAPYNPHFLIDQVKKDVIVPVKKAFKGPIVIGGSAVGISGAEMLSYFDLEFAIRGDGEISMIEFINCIENMLPIKNVGGLIWRKDNEIVMENQPRRVSDLDSLPRARPYHYIDLGTYRKCNSPIQVQTKRGCSLNCTYCTYNTIEGRKMRLRDPQLVADEIENIVKETGINHIEFTDSTFNIPLGHSKAVLRAIIAKKLDLSLQTMGLNPGAIDEEYADLLRKANFKDIHVSIESGSNKSLRNLGKNYTKSDILRAAKILHAKNFSIHFYVLAGAPGETEETLHESFETILQAAAKWDLIDVGNGIRVYKGSPIANQLLRENPGCTQDNFFRPFPFHPGTISLEKLREVNKRIALKYSNVMFYDDYQIVPFGVVKAHAFLTRLFAPNKPWWKIFVLFNRLMTYSGINLLKYVLSRKSKAGDFIPKIKWEKAREMIKNYG